MVFANKQDLPGGQSRSSLVLGDLFPCARGNLADIVPLAMSPAEVTEKLGLHKMKERSWYVHPRYVAFSLLDDTPVTSPQVDHDLGANSIQLRHER